MGTMGNKIEIMIHQRVKSSKEKTIKHQVGIGDIYVGAEHLRKYLQGKPH